MAACPRRLRRPRPACASRPSLRLSPRSLSQRWRSSLRRRPPAQVAVAQVVANAVDKALDKAVAKMAMAMVKDVVVVVAQEVALVMVEDVADAVTMANKEYFIMQHNAHNIDKCHVCILATSR